MTRFAGRPPPHTRRRKKRSGVPNVGEETKTLIIEMLRLFVGGAVEADRKGGAGEMGNAVMGRSKLLGDGLGVLGFGCKLV